MILHFFDSLAIKFKSHCQHIYKTLKPTIEELQEAISLWKNNTLLAITTSTFVRTWYAIMTIILIL